MARRTIVLESRPPRPVRPLSAREQHDQKLIAAAEYFTACVFLGRARYVTSRYAPSLPIARAAGRALADLLGRPGAVRGVNDAHVENVECS